VNTDGVVVDFEVRKKEMKIIIV